MRTYKAWTACARFVDPLLEELGAATPFLIEEDVAGWVGAIPLLELQQCDDMCRSLRTGSPGLRSQTVAWLLEAQEDDQAERQRASLATQLAFRLMAVQDIARRCPPSDRQNVPWTGNVGRDLEYLLVQWWHQNALYWAWHFGGLRL